MELLFAWLFWTHYMQYGLQVHFNIFVLLITLLMLQSCLSSIFFHNNGVTKSITTRLDINCSTSVRHFFFYQQ